MNTINYTNIDLFKQTSPQFNQKSASLGNVVQKLLKGTVSGTKWITSPIAEKPLPALTGLTGLGLVNNLRVDEAEMKGVETGFRGGARFADETITGMSLSDLFKIKGHGIGNKVIETAKSYNPGWLKPKGIKGLYKISPDLFDKVGEEPKMKIPEKKPKLKKEDLKMNNKEVLKQASALMLAHQAVTSPATHTKEAHMIARGIGRGLQGVGGLMETGFNKFDNLLSRGAGDTALDTPRIPLNRQGKSLLGTMGVGGLGLGGLGLGAGLGIGNHHGYGSGGADALTAASHGLNETYGGFGGRMRALLGGAGPGNEMLSQIYSQNFR